MKNPEKLRAVLIDRDGVINKEPGPILKPEAFRFVPGSIEAVARINQAAVSYTHLTLPTNREV